MRFGLDGESGGGLDLLGCLTKLAVDGWLRKGFEGRWMGGLFLAPVVLRSMVRGVYEALAYRRRCFCVCFPLVSLSPEPFERKDSLLGFSTLLDIRMTKS